MSNTFFTKTELIYEKDLARAAELLLSGEVVAFPTETVYGLGACIFLEEAIKKIFTVKGRPTDNPLIAHISNLDSLDQIAQNVPPVFYKLAEKFFPGPLTLVVPKSSKVSSIVSAGLSTIGIRMPSNPLALSLIRLVGQPLVAPSANLSGKPSSTDFLHVLEDFEGVIPAVVVGQGSDIGIESTVLSLVNEKIEILRPGSIHKEQIEDFLKESISICSFEGEGTAPSPGMKYRHYAPEAKVILFSSLTDVIAYCKKKPEMKRMILSNESSPLMEPFIRFSLSSDSYYSRLRLADRCHYKEILVVCDPGIQENLGFMNRIEKSSSGS